MPGWNASEYASIAQHVLQRRAAGEWRRPIRTGEPSSRIPENVAGMPVDFAQESERSSLLKT